MAAVDGPADRPTPMPMKARPARTHQASGARANSVAPINDAPRPANIAMRRPIRSEMPPKTISVRTTVIGNTAKIAVVAVYVRYHSCAYRRYVRAGAALVRRV